MTNESIAIQEKNSRNKKDINNAIYSFCLIFTGWALGIFLVVFFNILNDEKKPNVLSNESVKIQAASSPCIRLKMISSLDNTSQPLTDSSLSDIKKACSNEKSGSKPERWTEQARAQLEVLTSIPKTRSQ